MTQPYHHEYLSLERVSMVLDIVIIILYLAGILSMGLWYSRGIEEFQTFAVAGRSYPGWVIMATLSASFIGGGFSIGNAEKVFLFGILNIVALFGFSLKEMWVARYIAPHMDAYKDVLTIGDLVKIHYGEKAKIFTGLFAVLFCAGVLGAQVGAMGYIFQVFLGLPQMIGILIGCSIVILYSTYGGLKAIVFTDIIQFFLLIIGIPLTLFIGVQKIGGWSLFVSSIPTGHLSLTGTYYTVPAFLSLFLSFMLGEAMIPPYLQRLLIGRSSKDVERGVMGSALLSVPFFVVSGGIGLLAFLLEPTLNANLALPFVIQQVLPIGLRGLVVAGIISIVMSSADSFLHSATISFVHDCIAPLYRKEISTEKTLILSRIINVVVGAMAIFFALRLESILDILLYAYGFWAPVILIPIISAILGFKTEPILFLLAGIGGFLTVLVWNSLPSSFQIIDGLIPGVFINGLVFFGGARMMKSTKKEAIM